MSTAIDDHRLLRPLVLVPPAIRPAVTVPMLQGNAVTPTALSAPVTALCQVATGLVSAASFLIRQRILDDVALLAAVLGMPAVAAVRFVWMLREMSSFHQRRQRP